MKAAAARVVVGSNSSFAQAASYREERVAYWDQFAITMKRWERLRSAYRRRLEECYRGLTPPGLRVLELGSGTGDLLAALRPSSGVGVDFSPEMTKLAASRHTDPGLRFVCADAHDVDLNEQFDVILCSDLLNDVYDVQRVLETARRHSGDSTRLIINFYSHLWQGPRKIAEIAGVAKPLLAQNWLAPDDVENLLLLSDFEMVRHNQEILMPLAIPGLRGLCNRYLVKLWPFRMLALTNIMVARPRPQPRPEPVVTVVVPARNEAGNIANILDRVPEMGAGTDLVFVEGNSTDDTYATIEREIASRPGRRARLFRQTGKGKGDAVRLGFANADGELLMILDADLTVPPEDLPRFYAAWRSGKGDFINGVRLVYPMEARAMRFFNLLGNKFFSIAFSWLLGQTIKDTLCGTKVLSRTAYETIAANRSYFGHLDPFGDFDLIFGAAKYTLKMVDMPVRYRERTYGDTNIRRWSHGWLLLKMLALGMRRLKFV